MHLASKKASEHLFDCISPKSKIILPGGSSPLGIFKEISIKNYNWNNITILPSDERLVSIDDERSNFRLIKTRFVDKITCRKYPILYNYNLDTIKGLNQSILNMELPKIAVLGVGTDGHTASIFPGFKDYKKTNRAILKVKNKWESFTRVSLDLNFIKKSQTIIFLIFGKEKAQILKKILLGDYNPFKYPVQYIFNNYNNRINIFCDKSAAKLLR